MSHRHLVELISGHMVFWGGDNSELTMASALRSLGAAVAMVVTLSGCETKVTQISVVCRPGNQPTEPVHWIYTSKVDPSVIKEVAPALDITLHYPGADPRGVPPVTTYFYRPDGATLRVASSAKATFSPKGTFTYHVDTGGYIRALTNTGRGDAEELTFFIEVDGSDFTGVLSPPTCLRWPDHHLGIGDAAKVPNLKDRHPLNIGAADWIGISTLPPVIMRMEGTEVSTYAFFSAPIALIESKKETSVPDDVAKQEAEVGVTATTPTYATTGEPTPEAGKAPASAKGG
jgi:hypothetical protein